MNLHRFALDPLTFGPPPSQPLKRLSAHLGGCIGVGPKVRG
jgi:1-aminocyclopropane-1-carboxylate deaminase